MKKKTILYITELFPYPPTSGAKIKCMNTIQTLSKEFNITLVCFSKRYISKNNLDYIKKLTQNIKVFNLENLDQPPQDNIVRLIKNYLKLKPYFLYQFYSNEAKSYIDRLINEIDSDIIHIDHINMAQYLPQNKKQKWILEEHNIEHQLAWTKFLYFPKIKKTKIHLLIEYLLIYLFEKKTYKKFDHIFTISKFDKLVLKNKFNIKSTTTQTLVYKTNTRTIENKKQKTKNILFIGDITWFPNKLAIQWFVEKIFPLILQKEPNAKLNIVGQIEPEFSKKTNLVTGVTTHGFQKNIDKFFKRSSLFVMPFQSGGGVRIKALTAFSHQLPIVSTKMGVQGLEVKNWKNYFLSDNPKEFAKFCLILLKNKKIKKSIGENGYKYLKKYHSNKNNSTFIEKYLEVTQ